MKKVKDFNYYGKKRFKVQRYLRMLQNEKWNVLYVLIPLALLGLLFDIETNFSFSFTTTGGILSFVFFAYSMYYFLSFISLLVCSILDKYYFKKRKELLEQYINEQGQRCIVIGDKCNE